VIRQAISCDICGTEKRQTNHWFVAYEQGAELRLSEWNSRNRLRPESRHLCGQTCLHKLVDEFMARALAARASQAAPSDAADEVMKKAGKTAASLTPVAASDEMQSSARLIPTPAPATPARPQLRMPVELVVVPARPRAEEAAVPAAEAPRFASRTWRAAAWERERERELRASERHASWLPTASTSRR
jgi:hypothetical protein